MERSSGLVRRLTVLAGASLVGLAVGCGLAAVAVNELAGKLAPPETPGVAPGPVEAGAGGAPQRPEAG
jgi:hypothetical protein